VEQWKDWYELLYEKVNIKHFYSIRKEFGPVDSFETFLRGLKDALQGKEGEIIGDLIIHTHGAQYWNEEETEILEVKMDLPLFSKWEPHAPGESISPRLFGLSFPKEEEWSETDAEHIHRLLDPKSDYFNLVDGKDEEGKDKFKDPLISGVVKTITNHMDNSTHVWITGCALGRNREFMRALRKLFDNKPFIYATKGAEHRISGYYDTWDYIRIAASEVIELTDGEVLSLWSCKGMQYIVREPEFRSSKSGYGYLEL